MFYRIGLAGNQFADSDSVVVPTAPEADSADLRGPVALVSRPLPGDGSISVQERVVFDDSPLLLNNGSLSKCTPHLVIS